MKVHDYRYKAKRLRDGKIVKGTTEGPTKAVVSEYLNENGLRAFEIERYNSILGNLSRISIGKTIKEKDLIFFIRQLGSLLRSGVKLNEATQILASQQTSKAIRRIYYGIYYEVNGGQSLSEALREYPQDFPQILISMVKVGEETGELEDVLTETVDHFEKQYRLKTQIKSTMMMPLIYLVVAVLVAAFLMMVVLPQFEDLYGSVGGDLPGITVFFMNFSNFIQGNFLYIVLTIVLLIVLIRVIYKSSYKVRYFFSALAVRMPIFGSIVKLNNLSRIASTLAQMLKSHIPLQNALKTTYDTLNNNVYKELMLKAHQNVVSGELMSTAFEHHYSSEVVFTRMISVGETTGELGKMMKSLSVFYDEDSEIKIERLKKALEPVLLIFIYILLVIMILAVMLPSISLSEQLV